MLIINLIFSEKVTLCASICNCWVWLWFSSSAKGFFSWFFSRGLSASHNSTLPIFTSIEKFKATGLLLCKDYVLHSFYLPNVFTYLFFMFMKVRVRCNIRVSGMRHRVSSPEETVRRELKIWCAVQSIFDELRGVSSGDVTRTVSNAW